MIHLHSHVLPVLTTDETENVAAKCKETIYCVIQATDCKQITSMNRVHNNYLLLCSIFPL